MAHTALVLFDLDGTLADTAPDLAAAANRLRADRGLPPLPLARLRPYASHGARGLIGAALSVTPDDADYEPLRLRFLDYYAQALDVHTRLFDGVTATLAALEAGGLRWGIVTNKVARYTGPVVRALGLAERAAVVVSGDTTPHAKPHPAPLLHAAAACGVAASAAIYVGDDRRDIDAGRAAGLITVVATYGYLGDGDWRQWGADHAIDTPQQLLPLLSTLSA
jgi:2-phosphoglycolate phosphatase